MDRLAIDLETYSSVDIRKAGLFKYAQADDFEILLFAYQLNNTPAQVIDLASGETIPPGILARLIDPNTIKTAYNATFEWYCLKQQGIDTRLEEWRCTMAQGLYAGYPAGLAAISNALKLPDDKKKLATGRQLIKTFCTPRTPTRSDPRPRILPYHEPSKWSLFKEYCRRDVIAELAVADKLAAFPMPEKEQELWRQDVRMNATGVRIDRELVAGAIAISQRIGDDQMAEAKEISGLENPGSTQQLKQYLEDRLPDHLLEEDGTLDNLNKATVAGLLDQSKDEETKRLLQLKLELSKTSNKKYDAMEAAVCADDRVRGLIQYYGANRTGRWAGRLVQVQNLPRNHTPLLDLARDLVKAGNTEALALIFGNIPDILSQLIRTAFIPAPGHTILVSDYSAIEARVLAWMADERWRLDVFATHGKIYEASASAMFGVPIEKIARGNPEYALRQTGKVAELALGYQGSVGALRAMGAIDMGLSEEELPDIVARWRKANSKIQELWYTYDEAALSVVQTGRPVYANKVGFAREFDASKGMDYLTIQLPSGRKLYYANPHMGINRFGSPSLLYFGMDQVKKQWTQQETYGGKITENITQAIARDCLAETLLTLERAGHRTVMHIHDEVVVEAPKGTELESLTKLMDQPIPWAPGLILRGDGYETPYYKKD